jgi:hypothetical protein
MSFPIINRSLEVEFNAEVAVVNPGNVESVESVDNVEEEQEEVPLCDCTEVIAKPLFEAPIKLGECCICFEDMEMVNFMVTRCGHAFHASCMFRTLEMNDNCPMCRTQLIPDCVVDDDDSEYDYEEDEEGDDEEGDAESVEDEDEDAEERERRVEATMALAEAAKVVVELAGEQAVVEIVEDVLGKDLHEVTREHAVVEVVEEVLSKVVHEVTNKVINNYHNEIISRLFVGGNREEVCANVMAIMDEINEMKQIGCKCN